MPGPGEYRPDPSQGITRIEDLPKPKIRCQSRNYRRRPCPRCGQSAYRDGGVRRTLHDLGNPLTGRPRELIVIYSQHYCSRCRKYFNADLSDLTLPNSHYTLLTGSSPWPCGWWSRTACRTDQPPLAPMARPPCLRPLRHHSELGGGGGKKGPKSVLGDEYLDEALADFSAATSPPMNCTTGPTACCRSWITTGSDG